MEALHPIDLVAIIVLGVAGLRGLFNGLIREVTSIAALAAALFAVRMWSEPVSVWVLEITGGRVSATAAPWVAGALLGIGVLVGLGFLGRSLGRGARAVGLGWADRAGGIAVGFAEGALVIGILLMLGGALLGRDHSMLAQSRSLALLEQFESNDESDTATDVALPPPS